MPPTYQKLQPPTLRRFDQFYLFLTRPLRKDVNHCLSGSLAPFPAILYCFSTIDLLGALYAGDGKKLRNSTAQSSVYMKKFMGYADEQIRLLQQLFRHKIVHLAQPKAVVEDQGRLISWRYWHDNEAKHLALENTPGAYVPITESWPIRCDYEFNFSITHFTNDIAESVTESNGYLQTLNTTPKLQACFEQALEDIYDPKQ